MAGEAYVAYFSMEIAIDSKIPSYSGGLGVLAGDTVRSAADLGLPMVAVSLIHRHGYFNQKIDSSGKQIEMPSHWNIEEHLEKTEPIIHLEIEGRTVFVRAWRYLARGVSGFPLSVYLLDSDLPENSPEDRILTHHLYGGDDKYRLSQEAILGIGGIRILKALGYHELHRFHMNEGHASLLTLELLEDAIKQHHVAQITEREIETVRNRCVFTTHTPVPAGHDRFSFDLVEKVLGLAKVQLLKQLLNNQDCLNMTLLGFLLSRYINGVAKKHKKVSQEMFTGFAISSTTNGIHSATWASLPMQELFDVYIPGWREDNFSLRSAMNIPRDKLWTSHIRAKQSLFQFVRQQCNETLETELLTFGFARRMTQYKRPTLLFSDIGRLKEIATRCGRFQIIYAGKAHPQDEKGKELIESIHHCRSLLRPEINLVYLENYDMEVGKLVTAGVDIWLNTPEPPLEASGTSGMKAALNGVPSLSILDGWWIEGCIEGITGWAIDPPQNDGLNVNHSSDATLLYNKLENVVVPCFYNEREHFIDIMRQAISLNGSFFNTQRMVLEYVAKAYFF